MALNFNVDFWQYIKDKCWVAMKYRAKLVDDGQNLERPVQAFCPDPKAVEDWAREVLKKSSPEAFVEVYQNTEIYLGIIKGGDADSSKQDK